MLGFIVLVAFLAASLGVAGILFVLFGPVPVKRKITIVSRIQPPLMPLAAAPISLEPAMPVIAAPPPMLTAAAPLHSPVAMPLPPTARPPVAPPPVPAKATAVEPPIAPLVLRRPRGHHTPPPPRQRIARGTEPRPRHVFDSVELTAREAPRPRSFDTLEATAREAPTFELDDMTHVEDDARS